MVKKTSFDLLAEQYDRDFVEAPIGLAQRKLVYHYLMPLLLESSPLRVLDLGCGTGQDLVWIASHGHKVVGVDLSSEMIARAREKVEKHRLTGSVELKEVDISDYLASGEEDLYFDIIFSNFGAMNVVPAQQWRGTVEDIHMRTADGGFVVMVLLNSFCLWETLYFFMRGQWKRAGRRWSKEGVTFTFGSGSAERVRYYTPGKMASLFKPHYQVKKVAPIGCFVPPTYLQPFFRKRRRLLNLLYRMDRIALGLSPLAYLADHFMIILQKNG